MAALHGPHVPAAIRTGVSGRDHHPPKNPANGAGCTLAGYGQAIPIRKLGETPERPKQHPTDSRDSQYFNDLHLWNIEAKTQEQVNTAASSGCSLIGIDINNLQLEYPFEALLRERNPKVQFVHVNVTNQSKKYTLPTQPCRVVKLEGAP